MASFILEEGIDVGRYVAATVIAGIAMGCGQNRDGAIREEELGAEVDALKVENARLKAELRRITSDRERMAANLGSAVKNAAAANAEAVGALRNELAELRERLEPPSRAPDAGGLLVEPELDERLSRKVDRLRDEARRAPPSSCVRVLREIIEKYPNTRAALRAEGVLAAWGVLDADLEEDRAEIDARVRDFMTGEWAAGQAIQVAVRDAGDGRVEAAVRSLRGIAEDDGKGRASMYAREILARWGLAGADLDEVDFDQVGPRIQRAADAKRRIDSAFQMMGRKRFEEATRTFKALIQEYGKGPEVDRARDGLAQVEERAREHNQGRKRQGAKEKGGKAHGDKGFIKKPGGKGLPKGEEPEKKMEKAPVF